MVMKWRWWCWSRLKEVKVLERGKRYNGGGVWAVVLTGIRGCEWEREMVGEKRKYREIC